MKRIMYCCLIFLFSVILLLCNVENVYAVKVIKAELKLTNNREDIYDSESIKIISGVNFDNYSEYTLKCYNNKRNDNVVLDCTYYEFLGLYYSDDLDIDTSEYIIRFESDINDKCISKVLNYIYYIAYVQYPYDTHKLKYSIDYDNNVLYVSNDVYSDVTRYSCGFIYKICDSLKYCLINGCEFIELEMTDSEMDLTSRKTMYYFLSRKVKEILTSYYGFNIDVQLIKMTKTKIVLSVNSDIENYDFAGSLGGDDYPLMPTYIKIGNY